MAPLRRSPFQATGFAGGIWLKPKSLHEKPGRFTLSSFWKQPLRPWIWGKAFGWREKSSAGVSQNTLACHIVHFQIHIIFFSYIPGFIALPSQRDEPFSSSGRLALFAVHKNFLYRVIKTIAGIPGSVIDDKKDVLGEPQPKQALKYNNHTEFG
jgi:hypothetical protein